MSKEDKTADPVEAAKKELTLLLAMHFCFALFSSGLFLYGLISPGPFNFMVELQFGKPGQGQLPANLPLLILVYLGVLSVLNAVAVYSFKTKTKPLLATIASILNLFSVVGIPVGLTTLYTLRKEAVKALFS